MKFYNLDDKTFETDFRFIVVLHSAIRQKVTEKGNNHIQ